MLTPPFAAPRIRALVDKINPKSPRDGAFNALRLGFIPET
jgi:hypothetical protein